jgi:RimJ/RimL family protein N-acetyltransferase
MKEDIKIADYNILMVDKICRLFADIYPDQPEIVVKMCYDPSRQDHVATKVAYLGKDIVGQSNIFIHKALDGNANLGFHVHPSVRRQGIATILSYEAIKDARLKGISDIYIRTPEDNFAAIEVARKLGFTPDYRRFADKGFAVFNTFQPILSTFSNHKEHS